MTDRHSAQPLPASLLPISPRSPLLENDGRKVKEMTAQEVKDLLELARLGHFQVGISVGLSELAALVQAVDPETGDSALHIAASIPKREQLPVLEVLEQTQQRACGLDRRGWARQRARQRLIAHQNQAGDTALHVAARQGLQEAVTVLYRTFAGNHWTLSEPEFVGPTNDGDDPPEFDTSESLRDFEDECAKRLAFLLLSNRDGHTAASAARLAGRDGIARWLNDIAIRLDPERRFDTKEEIFKVFEKLRDRDA